MNMMDMIEEAQELCEKARVSVATEDCMDAAYKLCDLQVLLVRMEYEAKRDDVAITQKETLNSIPIVLTPNNAPKEAPGIGYVYTGQTTASVKENLSSIPVVCPSPGEMHEGGYVEPGQATVSEPRFDNQPNPAPTVTEIPDLNGTPTVTEEVGETGPVEGEVGEPTILDLRDEEIPHTSEVTAGSRFTLGGILGRH
ncbi:MAG: hypothetical protein ACI381_09595 [Candidatus Methanomethylophilaceae archaeon]